MARWAFDVGLIQGSWSSLECGLDAFSEKSAATRSAPVLGHVALLMQLVILFAKQLAADARI
jgi:hypothetical protein